MASLQRCHKLFRTRRPFRGWTLSATLFSDADSALIHTPLGAAMSNFAARLTFANGKLLEFTGPADITKESTEAIVNAANCSLLGGGGVDGAIHYAGGPSILQECKRIVSRIGTLAAGKAVITTGGRLPAKYVIHTVGPIYRGGRQHEAETLSSCYRQSIQVADDHGVRSIAFPSISTGAFGYPVRAAAEIAVSSVARVLPQSVHVELVRFVLFDIATCRAYVEAAEKLSQQSPTNPAIFEKGSFAS